MSKVAAIGATLCVGLVIGFAATGSYTAMVIAAVAVITLSIVAVNDD